MRMSLLHIVAGSIKPKTPTAVDTVEEDDCTGKLEGGSSPWPVGMSMPRAWAVRARNRFSARENNLLANFSHWQDTSAQADRYSWRCLYRLLLHENKDSLKKKFLTHQYRVRRRPCIACALQCLFLTPEIIVSPVCQTSRVKKKEPTNMRLASEENRIPWLLLFPSRLLLPVGLTCIISLFLFLSVFVLQSDLCAPSTDTTSSGFFLIQHATLNRSVL